MKQNSLSKTEDRINAIEKKINKLLEENVKDIKELKALLDELENLKCSLSRELKDSILSIMPEIVKKDDHSERINVIEGYYKILANYEGINKFHDLNALLYVLEDPKDLNEFNNSLKKILELLKSYNINIDQNSFDLTLYVNEYMKYFYEIGLEKDYLIKLKDKFDELYWNSHDLLKDIVLNLRIIIFDNVDNIIKELSAKKDKYITDNNINEKEVRKEYDSLRIEKAQIDSTDPEQILFSIKSNKINVDGLNEDSPDFISALETFVTVEYYSNCNKNDFFTNISCLKSNLIEYKYYEKYKYLILIIAEIAEKKDEYKTIYSDKKANIKKELDNKNKISKELNLKITEKDKLVNKKASIFLSEKSKNNKLDKVNKKIDELSSNLKISVNSIRTEYNEFDLSLFKEVASTSINKGYTILDDFSLFNNNVFVLYDSIKKYELNLTPQEIDDIYYKFHEFIMLPAIQIINTFDFNKEEDVALSIVNKYKLIDINFELNIDNVDDLIKSCQTIIDSYNLKTALLDPDIVKLIDKYYIVRIDNE